ncbi:unnamed protein product [Coffea canephora]|uniref:DH200=94 genomic scaffold, scaffold_10205 n=1 Tax=Coffea canephora TaxID=49390 RepID=A0A068VN86_COFCA|nr:unnamed protein product [Coffea canephora]
MNTSRAQPGTQTGFNPAPLRFNRGIARHRFGNRFDRSSTNWAGGVRMKPHINAISVKRMVAFGQQPSLFILLKLR